MQLHVCSEIQYLAKIIQFFLITTVKSYFQY